MKRISFFFLNIPLLSVKKMDSENYYFNNTNVIENKTRYIGSPYKLRQDDSNWVVSNAFIIFTMQTGKKNNFFIVLFVRFFIYKKLVFIKIFITYLIIIIIITINLLI